MPLTNRTKESRRFLPRLLGGAGATRRSPVETVREAVVQDALGATFVVPGDWIAPARKDALLGGGVNFPARDRNEVEYFINGEATFAAMGEALDTCTSRGHFVVLIGWAFDPRVRIPSDSRAGALAGLTFEEAFRRLGERGVAVRVLLWRQLNPSAVLESLAGGGDTGVVTAILNRLPNTIARADTVSQNRTGVNVAPISHHQKLMIVGGAEGVVGFYGGVDVSQDRVDAAPEMAGAQAFHDVHARIRGPAVTDLAAVARRRWLHQVDADETTNAAWPTQPASSPAGSSHARVYVTNSNAANPLRSDVRTAILSAIDQANRFIYVEDQYFWSSEVMAHLARRLPHLHHVTVLVPAEQNTFSFDQYIGNRRAALRELVARAGQAAFKIGIFQLTRGPYDYVHSKLWIVDDELAICGSANVSNRSFDNDSEIMVGHVDSVGWDWWRPRLSLVRRLRMDLWHRHLGIRVESLADGVVSGKYWRRAELTRRVGRVEPYWLLDDDDTFRIWRQIQDAGTPRSDSSVTAPLRNTVAAVRFRGQ